MVYNMTSTETEQKLLEIAKDCLEINTFKTFNNDSLDFHSVSTWSIKEALIQAYNLGILHRFA
jgi:hypothetical protein